MKFLLLSLMSFSSFASIQDLHHSLEVLGHESKFEVLKNAYETATTPATLSDFESYKQFEEARKYTCKMVKETEPEKLNGVTIAIFSRKLPANGPLFPGGAEEKVILGQDYWLRLNPHFDLFKNYTTNTDFIIRMPKNSQDVYADLGGEISIFLRKDLNYIPFKVQTISEADGPLFPGSRGKVHYYGYCYSK